MNTTLINICKFLHKSLSSILHFSLPPSRSLFINACFLPTFFRGFSLLHPFALLFLSDSNFLTVPPSHPFPISIVSRSFFTLSFQWLPSFPPYFFKLYVLTLPLPPFLSYVDFPPPFPLLPTRVHVAPEGSRFGTGRSSDPFISAGH